MEKELHKLRQSDPNRKNEGIRSTLPAHLQHPPVSMEQLRVGLRESNKVLHDVTREQLAALRAMSKDIPKPIKPYFYQTYITEMYLDRLKELDYDTLHPEMDVWNNMDMFKLSLKMTAASKLGTM